MDLIIGNNVLGKIMGKVDPTDEIIKVQSGKENLLKKGMLLTVFKIQNGVIAQREIMRVDSITGNIIGVARAVELCPLNENATSETQQALSFDSGDYFSHNLTAKQVINIVNEVNKKLDLDADIINKFNQANRLLKIDPDGKYPALDGSKIKNINVDINLVDGQLNYDRVEDIRENNYLPNNDILKNKHIHHGFVEANIIGIPNATEGWAYLQTINKWDELSIAHRLTQIATNSNKVWIRNSTSSTTWGEWSYMYTSSDIKIIPGDLVLGSSNSGPLFPNSTTWQEIRKIRVKRKGIYTIEYNLASTSYNNNENIKGQIFLNGATVGPISTFYGKSTTPEETYTQELQVPENGVISLKVLGEGVGSNINNGHLTIKYSLGVEDGCEIIS